jgi:HPt (histidine-containing phosphotransfer) domain-containing protein
MIYKFINTEYLDSVSGGDPEIINEIVLIFKDQCVEIYNEMVSLNSENEYLSLGLLAHKVKSSVAIMGMNDLATMLKTFEQQAKEGIESHLYESYIERFKTETDIAVVELEDLINTLLKRKV